MPKGFRLGLASMAFIFYVVQSFGEVSVVDPYQKGVTTLNRPEVEAPPVGLGPSRGPASGSRRVQEKWRSPSQAEQMLNNPRAARPGFIRPVESKAQWVGVCRSSIGGYTSTSTDPNGYVRCMDENSNYGARGAGVFVPMQ